MAGGDNWDFVLLVRPIGHHVDRLNENKAIIEIANFGGNYETD